MKVKKKSTELRECPKCKNVVTTIYRLDNWEHWCCANCFADILNDGEYIVDYDREIE